MNKNIFDIENINDLPKDLINKIAPKKIHKNTFQDWILSLFEIKDELSAKEIAVAYYRTYKVIKSIQQIQAALSHLDTYKQQVKRIRKGVYVMRESKK